MRTNVQIQSVAFPYSWKLLFFSIALSIFIFTPSLPDALLWQEVSNNKGGSVDETDQYKYCKGWEEREQPYILFSSLRIVNEKQHFMGLSVEPSSGFFSEQLVKRAF